MMEFEGVELRLAKAKPQVLRVLEADGVVDRIGRGNVHHTVQQAVAAQDRDGRTREDT